MEGAGAADAIGAGDKLTWKTGPGSVEAIEGARKVSRSSHPAMTCRATQSDRQSKGRSIFTARPHQYESI